MDRKLVKGVEVNIKKYASPASVFWDMNQNISTFLDVDKTFYTLRILLLHGEKIGIKNFTPHPGFKSLYDTYYLGII